MKILHCADLHLDSKLNSYDKNIAKMRNAELVTTFVRMVTYARENGIHIVLISGDMFDTARITATTRNVVLSTFREYAEITFYYLKGNHDNDNFLSEVENIPQNLILFDKEWKTFFHNKIAISGMELCSENAGSAYLSLTLDPQKFNIVMLHGQEAEGVFGDRVEVINLKALRNRGIDYLALGHIHGYKIEKLDARGIYCYPGCLEGRGFDECGEHGFVVIDIEEETGHFTPVFVPFAQRNLYRVPVDISGCMTTDEVVAKVATQLSEHQYAKTSFLKIELTGMLDVECEKDLSYILARFQQEYAYVKIYDGTRLKVSLEEYMLDQSLKGEFVRQVMRDENLTEDQKATIVRYGLQAIVGEEIQ